MDEIEIKNLLNDLSEYHARRDLVEYDKKKLIEDVKYPEEIESVIKKYNDKKKEIAEQAEREMEEMNAAFKELYDDIEVPPEVKEIVEKIELKRMELSNKHHNELDEKRRAMNRALFQIDMEIQEKTKDVFRDMHRKIDEINAEFTGKYEAATENINKLEDKIKVAVKALGHSVKGDHYHAVLSPGRITWNTDKMEAWKEVYPFLKEARKEGEPSVALKRI
jgi:chromosome segregation ATPase